MLSCCFYHSGNNKIMRTSAFNYTYWWERLEEYRLVHGGFSRSRTFRVSYFTCSKPLVNFCLKHPVVLGTLRTISVALYIYYRSALERAPEYTHTHTPTTKIPNTGVLQHHHKNTHNTPVDALKHSVTSIYIILMQNNWCVYNCRSVMFYEIYRYVSCILLYCLYLYLYSFH